MGADLLQALKVLTELGVKTVGNDLVVLAIGDVALSVKEPRGDLVLGRGLEDGNNALQLLGGELTSTNKKMSALPLGFGHNCPGLCNVFPNRFHSQILLRWCILSCRIFES